MYTTAGFAQNKQWNADSLNAVLSKPYFVYVPQTAFPLKGSSRMLTGEFSIAIHNDSITSYLPYFGQVYASSVDQSQGRLDFTSTNFGYDVKKAGKAKWQITVKPKDAANVQELDFTVFDNGRARLTAVGYSQQTISFDGYIQ